MQIILHRRLHKPNIEIEIDDPIKGSCRCSLLNWPVSPVTGIDFQCRCSLPRWAACKVQNDDDVVSSFTCVTPSTREEWRRSSFSLSGRGL